MNERGFTLVEVLAALMLSALLLIPVSWMIADLSQDLAREKEFAAMGRVDADAELLSNLLRGARFVDTDGELLERSDKSLAFTAPAPLAKEGSGLLSYRLAVSSGDDGALSLALQNDDGSKESLPLFPGMSDARFEYAEAGDPRWPNQVKLNLVDGKGEKQRFVFEPLINGDGSCRFDPVSLQCR